MASKRDTSVDRWWAADDEPHENSSAGVPTPNTSDLSVPIAKDITTRNRIAVTIGPTIVWPNTVKNLKVSLQYNELHVNVTCRSIKELIRIRDVKNPYDNYPFKAPNFNEPSDQLYRFLQTPPGIELNYNDISLIGENFKTQVV